MKIGTPSKLIDFVFLAVFMGYSTQFLAPGTISIARDSVHENWDVVKARRFGHFWPFSWAIAHNFFGSGDDFNGSGARVHENWDVVKTRRFGHF